MESNGSQQPRPLQMGAKGAYIVRLLMVGDSACGKTSLVLRFDQNVFSSLISFYLFIKNTPCNLTNDKLFGVCEKVE